ncbi:MAG: endonuclease III, partial [Gammaproteobacteria bacterium]
MNKANREEFFRRLKAQDPAPRTELEYDSDFQLLIAVILSAQATDVSVNKATPALFAASPDAAAMLSLGD